MCGLRWHTCTCPQWDENRLVARAAETVDRNPRRGLFQPMRVAHVQPATRRQSAVSNASTVAVPAGRPAIRAQIVASPASSVWQSDFSEHSEWEQLGNSESEHDNEDGLQSLREPPEPATLQTRVAVVAAPVENARDLRIAAAVEHLRVNHVCDHEGWRWIRGQSPCEECHHVLKEYIFECRQCNLRACNRCRRNGL